MQLWGQNGFYCYESLVCHRRETLEDKAKSCTAWGEQKNRRPRRSVLFNSSDVTRERAFGWTLLERFPTPSGNGWNS